MVKAGPLKTNIVKISFSPQSLTDTTAGHDLVSITQN